MIFFRLPYFIFLLLFTTMCSAAELTERSVQDLLNKLDNAIAKLDADAVAETLSDNISITFNITTQGAPQVLLPSKAEYVDMLKQGWEIYDGYYYSRSNVKIIIDNNKALVTADVEESMNYNNREISSVSKEEATIEIINDELLLTKIVGHIDM